MTQTHVSRHDRNQFRHLISIKERILSQFNTNNLKTSKSLQPPKNDDQKLGQHRSDEA